MPPQKLLSSPRGFSTLAFIGAVAVVLAAPTPARADAKDVGLGVAGGVAYSPTKVGGSPIGAGVAWGFFVDIPLLSTFYITPSATIYQLDLADGPEPATDIDLNFKFIVPIVDFRLGAGILAGLTTAEGTYHAHYGLTGYFSYNLVANLDLFIMAQYKRMARASKDLDHLHAHGGLMFRF